MTGTDLFHNLWRMACLSFLVFVCCGHVYLSAHLHHFHANGSVAFEVSFNSSAVEVAHTAHQHDEHSPHEDEDEHKYKKKNDWRVSRSKSTPISTFEAPEILLSAYHPPRADTDKIKPSLQALCFTKERFFSFPIIRGPPRLA